MKKFVFLLIIGYCHVFTALAQQDVDGLLHALKQQPKHLSNGLNSVLWEVRFPRSSKVTYFLGTHHYYGQEWIAAFPKVDSLINASELFVCESLHGIDSLALKSIREQLMTENRSSANLFRNDFTTVDRYLMEHTGSGLVANLDNSSEPKLAVISRIYTYLFGELAAKNNLKINKTGDPMDRILLKHAVSLKKASVGLDPIEMVKRIYTSEQIIDGYCLGIIAMVEDLQNDNQADTREGIPFYQSVLANYSTGLYLYDFQKKPVTTALVEERNRIWMRSLPGIIKQSNSFIAVGSGHLDTKGGILKSLVKLGYVLRAIKLD